MDKGDKVVVNGAFLGTVVQVDKGDEKDPEDKLVVKIDENANIKMRVLRSSVTRVYKKEPKDGVSTYHDTPTILSSPSLTWLVAAIVVAAFLCIRYLQPFHRRAIVCVTAVLLVGAGRHPGRLAVRPRRGRVPARRRPGRRHHPRLRGRPRNGWTSRRKTTRRPRSSTRRKWPRS